MEKIEVLIATMNQENYNFIENMNLSTDAVIVNQCLENKKYSLKSQLNCYKIIESSEKGLSKSRNLAIKNSNADICLLADDDEVLEDDYELKILNAYDKHPDADIIAFQVQRQGNPNRYKRFRKRKSWDNYLTCMKIASVEISFRRESIVSKGIRFNENIGAGRKFSNGEENIFLYDALKNGLKILYLPINIGYVDNSESSWFKGYTDDYFYSAGAKFYNMSKHFYPLLILQFAVRKYSIYKDNYSLFKATKKMFDGVNQYKDEYCTDY